MKRVVAYSSTRVYGLGHLRPGNTMDCFEWRILRLERCTLPLVFAPASNYRAHDLSAVIGKCDQALV